MREFELGECASCETASGIVCFFRQEWARLSDDDDYPCLEDLARYRDRYAEVTADESPMPTPLGGYFETAEEFVRSVVATILYQNKKYGIELAQLADKFQRIVTPCRGQTLGRTATVGGQMAITTICASERELSDFPKRQNNQ